MTSASSDERTLPYVVGLAVAHLILVLLAVWAFSAGFQDYKWPRWQSTFVEALACSQVGLSATILAVGNMRLSVRIIAAVIVLLFWLIALDALDLGHENWLEIFGIQFVGICVSLVPARVFGARLVSEQIGDEQPLEAGKYRFSLRQILSFTAATAFLLGLWTVVRRFWGFQPSIDWGVQPRAMTLGLCLIPIMITALWVSMGTSRRIMPAFVLVFVTVLGCFAAGTTDRLYRTAWYSTLTHERYESAYWYLVGLYAFVVYLSLLVLRASGCRIARRSRMT